MERVLNNQIEARRNPTAILEGYIRNSLRANEMADEIKRRREAALNTEDTVHKILMNTDEKKHKNTIEIIEILE